MKNKVAIVTGSSRGIGAQIAMRLAQQGTRVVINYATRTSAADAVMAAIESENGEAIAIQADVAKPNEVSAMFETTIARFGKVDILVNNAGYLVNQRIEDTSDDDFDRSFAVNVKGVFNTLREAAKRLENGGRIINISSSTTGMLLPTYGTYCATKGAVEQFTRILAKEIGHRGITVNAVSPGPTNTELFTEGKSEAFIQKLADMSPLGRIAEPEDIARVVLFLASDASEWITGQIIRANGGLA
jgi:3-oxoacyl-[acyl-carrier protein] reductase